MLEDIVKQIRAVLQNQLPGKLDQIELERADGVTLEDIQSFFVQEGHRDVRLKYPAIAILGEVTTASNTLSYRRELMHRTSVWIIDRVVSPDSELSQVRLLRYVEAMERILAKDPTLGGKAIDSTIIRHKYFSKSKLGEGFVRIAELILEAIEMPSTKNY